jgi:SAM-dependent methyltransferase
VPATYEPLGIPPWMQMVCAKARMRMLAAFFLQVQPEAQTTILDVGALSVPQPPVEANMLEKVYPYPRRLTVLGLEDGRPLRAQYPQVRYIQYGGGAFPLADRSVDVCYSHAVLEHVGTHADRRRFVEECLRVAGQVWLTTPNRWYPVDFHTLLPLVHWLPRPWHRTVLRRLGQDFFAQPHHLHLLSRGEVIALFRQAGALARVQAFAYGGLPAIWLVHAWRDGHG